MSSADTRVFSVIVKIWVQNSDPATWHGKITHIPSGEQQYVSRVEDIALIISQHLEVCGFHPSWWVRLWGRIRRSPVR